MSMLGVVIPTWNPYRACGMVQEIAGIATSGETEYFVVHPEGAPDPQLNGVRPIRTGGREGVLRSMAIGGRAALDAGCAILAFFHDDIDIEEESWDEKILNFFEGTPECGLAGFGGAFELGTHDLYKKPYAIPQLARVMFVSNMRDWITHGRRVVRPIQVSVLDGFSQILTKESYEKMGGWEDAEKAGMPPHHMYDAFAACRMKELSYEVWVLPLRCHHYGGLTATSQEYQDWLMSKGFTGDVEVHVKAHRVIYERFRNVLPLRTPMLPLLSAQ